LRIVFDKNVPVGVRRFLSKHDHGAAVAAKVDAAIPGSYEFVEMPLAPKRR
jgi:hypothetical protein